MEYSDANVDVINQKELDDAFESALHDESLVMMEMEKRIKDLESQVQHFKSTSNDLQQVILEAPLPPPTEENPKKRRYNYSEDNAKMRAYVKEHLSSDIFAADLRNGVGLKDCGVIPRALLRAYITMRYQQDNRDNK